MSRVALSLRVINNQGLQIGTNNIGTIDASLLTTSRIFTFQDASYIIAGRDTIETLTNKTLTAPIISSIENSGTVTIPSGTDTLVGRDTTDTLTNKTLTAPIISSIENGGTVTIPSGTDTLVGRDTTDTLTNKTLTGTSNDIEANKIGQGSDAVIVSGTAGLGKVLKATSSSTAVWQDTNLSEIGSVVTTSSATETLIYTLSTDDNTTYMISASIAGHRTDAGFESVSVVIKCCYKRLLGTNTLVQIGEDDTVRFNDTNASSWIISSNANTSNGEIEIKVTGEASKTIKWKAILNVTSV